MAATKNLFPFVCTLIFLSSASATAGDTTYSCAEDAEQLSDGFMRFDSFDLEIPLETDDSVQTIGLRYQNIDVPPGATIDNAFITFQSEELGFGDPRLLINAQLTGDAGPFQSQAFYLSSLPLTSETVLWTGEPLWPVGTFHTSPELKAVIQEIVDRGTWARFNDIVFVIRRASGSTGRRVAESIEGAGIAPRLTVRWTLITDAPTLQPTQQPTGATASPTLEPTNAPSVSTVMPSNAPTSAPTLNATLEPTGAPTFAEIIQADTFSAAMGVLGSMLVAECCGVGALLWRRRHREQQTPERELKTSMPFDIDGNLII